MTQNKVNQSRFPFPDYPPEEQEKDAKRYAELQKKDVYIMRVNGVWGAFLPRPKHSLSITGERGEELADFITNMKLSFEEDYKILPRFRCVINKGIEDHLIQQIEIQKLLASGSRGNR